MRKIFLLSFILISIQSNAESSLITKEKIMPPPTEKYVPKSVSLTHNPDAKLITEQECFQQSEQLIKGKFESDDDKTNYNGYSKHVKNLTEFTNSKGRGMTCNDSFLFYYVEVLEVIEKFVKSQVEVLDTMDKMVANSEKSEQESVKKAEQIKLDKDYKNHPYKETWYDYEKGIYEIRLVENKDEKVREDIEKELAKMEYNPIRKCKFKLESSKKTSEEIFSKEFDTEYFIYDYNLEDFMGLINAHINKKVRGLLIETPLNKKILFSIRPHEDYEDYMDELDRLGGSSISFLQVENIEDIKIVEKEKSYIWPFERINMKRQNNLRGTLEMSFNYTKREKYIQLNYSITGDFKNNYIKYLKDTNIDLYNNAIINGYDGNWYFEEEGPGSIRLSSFILNNKLIIYRSKCFGSEYGICGNL